MTDRSNSIFPPFKSIFSKDALGITRFGGITPFFNKTRKDDERSKLRHSSNICHFLFSPTS